MGQSEEEIVRSLFQKDLSVINDIPFENRNKMLKIRKEIAMLLERYSDGGIVSTKYQEMQVQTYIPIFTRNIFDSMLLTRKLLNDHKCYDCDVSDILFHGTTTVSLSSIIEKGLLPSEAGRNWIEDKEKQKRVYLTDSLYKAEAFAFKAMKASGGDLNICRVNVKNFKNMLEIAHDDFHEPLKAFQFTNEFSTTEPIPPIRIRNFYAYPKSTSLSPRLLVIMDYYSWELANSKEAMKQNVFES